MSEPRFTKGPWYTISAGVIRAGGTEGDDRPRRIVARIEGCMDNSAYMTGLTEEQANEKLIERCPELYRNSEDEIVHLQTLKNQIMSLLGMVKPIPLVTPEFTLKYIDQIIDDTEKLLERARGEA